MYGLGHSDKHYALNTLMCEIVVSQPRPRAGGAERQTCNGRDKQSYVEPFL